MHGASSMPGSRSVGVGSIFAFGLVAFGFLCMGPVNIAVDSYGPVTDNAQSIFELAQTEHIPGIKEEIKRDFGFEPDFERGKHYLEANDSAGNTFKATAKPVLIGTAVVGATTMIFSIILLLGKAGMLHLSLTDAPVLLGFICGGAVIFWFCGASMQAVTTGAYRAVEFIKKNMNLDKKEADIEDSKTVVRICTQYAQSGMWNIFIALMSITLAFAFFDPNFFVAYLISIAVFGLFQAIYMANAGGAWDNAKKLVEVDLKEKGTPLHAATVIGDTVGDPFKDTTSVALNPIIKFSTLFGLLAVEIAVEIKEAAAAGTAQRLHALRRRRSCWRSRWSSSGGRSTPCGFPRKCRRIERRGGWVPRHVGWHALRNEGRGLRGSPRPSFLRACHPVRFSRWQLGKSWPVILILRAATADECCRSRPWSRRRPPMGDIAPGRQFPSGGVQHACCHFIAAFRGPCGRLPIGGRGRLLCQKGLRGPRRLLA